ncbi:hypothetical protein F4677DRAFT_402756 [Hypoxylon crocopeplum]|nr:hypothetical protein F4677DRAFT_402756 [Hypoxylon crocopeplum]
MASRSVGGLFFSSSLFHKWSLPKYNSLSIEEPIETNFDDTGTAIQQEPKVSDHRHHSALRSWRTAIISILTLLFGISVIIAIQSHDFSPRASSLHCGRSNTTAEAEVLGCVFDILSYSWTPRQCFDEDTASEFNEWLWESGRQMGAFPFFYDVEGKDRIQDEQALGENFGTAIHTTQEEHLAHCTFMMRRIHRVSESNGRLRLNSRYGSLEHTKHCSHEILKSLERKDLSYLGGVRSRFGVSFERC